MKRRLKYYLILSLLIVNLGHAYVQAESISEKDVKCVVSNEHFGYQGNITLNKDVYDTQDLKSSDFNLDGTFTFNNKTISNDNVKVLVFSQKLINDKQKEIELIMYPKGEYDSIKYRFIIDVVPFDGTLRLKDDILIINDTKELDALSSTFINSLNQELTGSIYLREKDIHYGYNNVIVPVKTTDGIFNVKTPITLCYNPYNIGVYTYKNSIKVYDSEFLEYSLDGCTWQDSNKFSSLKANTKYTIYCRAKATDNLEAGTIVEKTVRTKK